MCARVLLSAGMALLLGLSPRTGVAATVSGAPGGGRPVVWQVGVLLQRPYAQLDASGQRLQGANIELMNRLAARLRIRLAWHPYAREQQLYADLARGVIDVAPGLEQTPQGLKVAEYSAPVFRVPSKVVGLRGRGPASVSLESLPLAARLSLVAASPLARFMAAVYPVLQQAPQTDERAALQAILQRRADYAAVDEAQLAGLLRETAFLPLTVVGDTGFTRLLRIAVRKDRGTWAELIDSGVQQLPPHELKQVSTRWLQPEYPTLTQQLGFWRDLCLLLLLLLVGLALHVLWRVRQAQRLQQRLESLRQQLEQHEDEREMLRLPQFTLDNSTVGILWIGWDSRVRYANQAASLLLAAADSDDLRGRPVADCYPGLSGERWRNAWNHMRASGAMKSLEAICQRLDGEQQPLDVALSFLRFGGAEYLVVFLTDASERHRDRAALQESQARLKGIAANVPGLVFRLERASRSAPVELAFLSEAASYLLGHAPTRLEPHLGRLLAWVWPPDRAGFLLSWQRALEGDGVLSWQGRIKRRQGPLCWIDLRATQRVFDDGRMVWDGIAWDVTASKESELTLAAQRESAREEEKARIAREVHDELGQMLAVLRLEISMCELAFSPLDAGLQTRLDRMRHLIEQTFQIVRDVARALRPPILDAGIVSAVEWQMRRFEQRSQIPVLVSVPDTPITLADEKAIGLLRILQECLTNVMRHARANTVSLTLQADNGFLDMRVRDDGVGFDAAAAGRGASLGLAGMRERVALLNGTLQIDSQPGQGSCLHVRVPLDESE